HAAVLAARDPVGLPSGDWTGASRPLGSRRLALAFALGLLVAGPGCPHGQLAIAHRPAGPDADGPVRADVRPTRAVPVAAPGRPPGAVGGLTGGFAARLLPDTPRSPPGRRCPRGPSRRRWRAR